MSGTQYFHSSFFATRRSSRLNKTVTVGEWGRNDEGINEENERGLREWIVQHAPQTMINHIQGSPPSMTTQVDGTAT